MDATTIAQDVLNGLSAEGVELPIDLNQAEGLVREWVGRIGVRVCATVRGLPDQGGGHVAGGGAVPAGVLALSGLRPGDWFRAGGGGL